MSTPKLCKLLSSHGEVTFDTATGMVTDIVRYDPDDPDGLPEIYKVNVVRLLEVFPDLGDEIDIVNAGFWYLTERGGTEYEPPDPNHEAWAAGKREFPWGDDYTEDNANTNIQITP
jgi:hypothetical protein